MTARASHPIAVPEDLLGEVRRLYDVGRYLDAFAVSRAAGELRHWAGTRARIMGGRLASSRSAASTRKCSREFARAMRARSR